MANITLDFLHNYHTGERRESDPANAYQYDEGHVLEAVLPEVVTSAEINYWIRGMENADAYAPGSITPNEDGSCTVLGNIPNKYFETNGELRIYIVVNDDNASITTYEGMLHICQRSMPDDYVDDDPENEATRVLIEAQEAAATATAAAQTAQDVADSIPSDYTQLSNDVSSLKEELSSKAEIDGYYEDMTVGDAEQLVASQYVEDSVPYNCRTTGGSADVGNREYVDAVVGGTVAWNQLVHDMSGRAEVQGITRTVSADRTEMTYSGTAIVSDNYTAYIFSSIVGHKYLLTLGNVTLPSGAKILYSNVDKATSSIKNATATSEQVSVRISTGTSVNFTAKIQVFDLTQMFGSTIADYIYSLEQATAGAGVAWFKKLFPNDYYEYDTGTLKSVEGLSSHDMVGFNQWDEEWELGVWSGSGTKVASDTTIRSKNYIPVLPSTVYYCCFGSRYTSGLIIRQLDASKQFLATTAFTVSDTFTTLADCRYIVLCTYVNDNITTYNHDICINLSWSGWRNGEYEAYQKHSYPLDDSLILRGIPKLDAQNNLYYDGDEYLSDGTVTRKYAVADTFSRGALDSSGKLYNIGTVSDFGYTDMAVLAVCNLLPVKHLGDARIASDNGIKSVCLYGTSAYVGGFIGSEADLDALLPNLKVVYQLDAPTTETADPYQHVQICDDFGTEEYVSTSIVPVGHETRYPANLRDKLQHLPDLADDDGYYMIGQSNKQMHLELFRIPKAPTMDGAYILKATVSGGTPTYTWEAQT
jgi:hypothetical protein